MIRLLIGTLVLLLVGCSGRRDAPAPAAPGPEAVARTFLDALAAERWQAAARLVDRSALEECHARWLDFAWPERVEYTVDEMVRMQPDMPREVAEWTVDRMREDAEIFGHTLVLSEIFAGVETLEELRALGPVEALARRFEAGDPRVRERRIRERWPEDRPGEPMVAGARATGGQVVGTIPLGSDFAHVVYHGPASSVAGFLILRGGADGWSVLPVADPFSGLPLSCSGSWSRSLARAWHGLAPEGEALAVVERLAAALERRDWDAAAALAEPDRLREWRDREASLRRRLDRRPDVEALMEEAPGMPRAVAEYQVESMRRSLEQVRAMAGEYGALSPADLAMLPPRRALAMALESRDPAYRLRNFLDHLEPGSEEREEAEAVLRAFDSRVRPIGQVAADSTAYVLYRRDPERPPPERTPHVGDLHLARLHRTSGGWRVDPDDMLYRYMENFSVIRTEAGPDPH